MHQRERALEPLVAEVGIELAQLLGREHALVDDDPHAQRREVGVGLVLDALAREIDVALELVAGETVLGDEHLREGGHLFAGRRSRLRRVDRHLPPTEHVESLVGEHLGDVVLRALRLVGRQEPDPRCVRTGCRELEAHGLAVEAIGRLDEDARAVTRVRLGAGRAAVAQAADGGERLVDDRVALATLHVHDEAHATRVVFEPRVVQRRQLAFGHWQSS